MKNITRISLLAACGIMVLASGCIQQPFLREDPSRSALRKDLIYQDAYVRAVDDSVSAIWGDSQAFLIKGKMVVMAQPRYTDGIVVYEPGIAPYIVTYPYYHQAFNIQEAQNLNEKEKNKHEQVYDYSVQNFEELPQLPRIPAAAERDMA